MKHENNGKCPHCQEVLDLYPNFYKPLREWFEAFQVKHPEAHISEAGRGELAQERDFAKGASKAHYGRSAHNYNCALDLFSIRPGKDLYATDWYHDVLAKELATQPWLEWGWEWKSFPEMPHVQVRDFEKLGLPLVEPKKEAA